MINAFAELNEFAVSKINSSFFRGNKEYTVTDLNGSQLFCAKRGITNEIISVASLICVLVILYFNIDLFLRFFPVIFALWFILLPIINTRKVQISIASEKNSSMSFNLVPEKTWLSLRNRYDVIDRSGVRIGRVIKYKRFKWIWSVEDISGNLLFQTKSKFSFKKGNIDLIDTEGDVIGKTDYPGLLERKYNFHLMEGSKGIDQRLVIGLAVAMTDHYFRQFNRLDLS